MNLTMDMLNAQRYSRRELKMRSAFPLSALILVALVAFSGANPAGAEEAQGIAPGLEETGAVIMDPVVVIAAPERSPLETILNPRQAQLPVPASDATDLLKTVPGFSAIRSGGANGDPVFRGMFGSRINILTNGSNMLGACPNRMDAPSSYISPDLYDQVTIIKGPQTVLWGGGASAATIRFDRLPERFIEPGARFRSGVLAGSYDHFEEYMDAAAGTENFYVRINANHGRSSDYKDGNGNRVPSEWMKWNTDAAIGWTPNESTLLELSAGAGNGYARYAGRGMDGDEFERESFNLRFEKSDLGPVLSKLEAQAYYNYTDHVMDNYSLRTPAMMRMRSNPTRTVYGGRVAATLRLGEISTLVTGFDVQLDSHDTSSSSDPVRQKDMEMFKTGIFGEVSNAVGQNDKIILGLRGDYIKADDLRAGANYDDNRSTLLPGAFIRHEHNFEDMPLMSYIGVGYTERFPDYWELRQNTRNGMHPLRAFPDLEPEKTWQLDAGLQYNLDNLSLWLSAYVGLINDYILFNYDASGMPAMGADSTVKNINARITGAELGASYLLFGRLRLDAALAYAWGENTNDGRPLPQIPPLELRLGASYETEKWQAGVLWRVVAKQDRVAVNQGNVVGKDFGQSSGFGVLSAYSSVTLTDHFTLSAGIDNIFDRAYYEHLNLAGNAGWGFSANENIYEPGRVFWAKLSAEF
jgi:iron complex outermembrane receptor protein